MSRRKIRKLEWVASRALLVGAGAAGLVALAATTGSHAPSARAAVRAVVPSIDATQTCPTRVEPRTSAAISAAIVNTGDVQFVSLNVEGDAGTQDNTADDFPLAYQSGDANNNQLFDPGETWNYAGAFRVGDGDLTDIVSAEARDRNDGLVTDLAPCEIDVVQPPQPGVIVGVRSVRGTVRFRRPGSNTFITLEGTTEIPVGSQVDTTKGTVRLTAGLGGGRTNTADFSGGIFTILQSRARGSVTTLRLDKGNFGICRGRSAAASLAAKSKRPVRRLLGSGRGRFRSLGRGSSATVRGTIWLVVDRCDGTLTQVTRGVVQVRDFRLRRNVTVRAGQSYLARVGG